MSDQSTPTSTVDIPQWQVDSLNQMAQSNQLAGTDPSILAAIDAAESVQGTPTPFAANGQYQSGGFFGLSGAYSVPQQDQGPSQSDFEAQAAIAGSEWQNTDLPATGGASNYAAEEHYQGGSTQGVGVFQSLGVPDSPSGPYPTIASGQRNSSTAPASSTTPAPATGAVTGITTAVTTALGGATKAISNLIPTWGPSWAPWNWGADAGNAIIRTAMPFVCIILGVILVAWGLDMTFRGGTKVSVVGAPPPAAPKKAGGLKQAAEHDAEHGAEAAAVA